VRESKAGTKFLSLKVQEPREKKPKPVEKIEDMPEDLPF